MKRLLLSFITFAFPALIAFSQVEIKYYPEKDALEHGDFLYGEYVKKHLKEVKLYQMPPIDTRSIQAENEKREGQLYCYGKNINTSYGLDAGTWFPVDGGRLWMMSVVSKNACSLNFILEDFRLSDNSRLYIINEENSVLYGPITYKALPKKGRFLTDIIDGQQATLILYEPDSEKNGSSFVVNRVIHGCQGTQSRSGNYGEGASSSCNIDVACYPVYQQEANAVGRIIVSGSSNSFYGSGALVMATDCLHTPYFLMSAYTIDINIDGVLSASEIADVEDCVVRFGYKKTTCGGSGYTTGYTYNGSTFRAACYNPNFALIELGQDVSQNSNLSWLGWDRASSTATMGIGIHHPLGDAMKIAIDDDPISSPWAGYFIARFDYGVTENCSEGSPLLNEGKRVIGILALPSPDPCSAAQKSMYVPFSYAWYGGGTDSTRLSNWLDPLGTSQTTIDTNISLPESISGNFLISSSNVYSVGNLPSGFTVEWNLSDSYYNQNCLQQNTPSANQCTITRSNSYEMTNATLTAAIKYNGTTVRTLTKTGIYAYYDFKGQYTSGNLSGNINYTHTFTVKPSYTTYITSLNLIGATASYSNIGTTPNYWGFNPQYGELQFVMPANNNNIPVIINVDDACGNYYQLYAMPQNYKGLNISLSDNGFTVTLDGDNVSENRGIEQPWTIEVRSANTGELKAIQAATTRSATVFTAGWPKGTYIVKVTVGNEVLTEKVIVK